MRGGVGEGALVEKTGHLAEAAAREEEAEVVEIIGDMVGDAVEPRFLPEDNAVAGSGKAGEDATNPEGVGAGDDAEIAGAAPEGIAGVGDVVVDGFAEEAVAAIVQAADPMAHPAIQKG